MSSSIKCPVVQFCEDVKSGKLIQGPWVRLAAERHMKDLKTAAKRKLQWRQEECDKAIKFFETKLKLNGGDYEGLPFTLLSWQKFVIGSIYGWYKFDPKLDAWVRRFRNVYVETGKGSGKSPLAAGVGIKGLVADGEPRAEIYSAATKKDQAMILFRDAVAMRDLSDEIRTRVTKQGVGERAWNLAYPKTGSFFRPISADEGQSGPRPHIGLIDELHEHKTNAVIEMLRAGTKSRRNAMLFSITNSGAGRKGPCWAYHEYGIAIVKGDRDDDSFFAFICALDEEDDPFKSEDCWPKANPSLQEANLPGYGYIREQVTEAKGMPGKESTVRRLNFCEWTGAESPWLSYEVWKGAYAPYELADLRGRRALAGLDMSSTTDLCALVFLVEPLREGEPWKLVPFCWLPEQTIEERAQKDNVPYDVWRDQGLLETTPGKAISKRVILQRLTGLCDYFEVIRVAYDRWRIEDLIALANDEGITLPEMVPFGQGFKDMAPAVSEFERLLLSGELVHNGHKVLTMCAGNAVIEQDAAENRKLSKEKATGRIDLIVAAVMAAGLVAQINEGEEDYDEFLRNPIIVKL